MKARKLNFSKIAVLISVALHLIVFFALAWVKIYTDRNTDEAEILVAFVQGQKARVLRRSIHVRPAASLDKSPQHRPLGQRTKTRLDYRTPSDFYISDAPKIFSQVKNLGNEALQGTDLQRPSVDFGQGLTEPIAIELRESDARSSQAQLGISGGHELLGDASLELPKPEMRMGSDIDSALQRFFDAVRKKIESRKKYPMSARNLGIEGRSGVKLTILKNGQLEKVEIADSSGHEVLDNAALQSIRDAVPFPPIPEEAGREKIEMSIYLVFKIT